MKKIFLIIVMLSVSLLADFSKDGNINIVTDNETGLQWQDNERKNMTWQNAISYCEQLGLNSYDDWRLPNINELNSIVDDTQSYPSINPMFKFFASDNYRLASYWSSTNIITKAWIVDFMWGSSNMTNKGNKYYVRCVRTGQ
jgi:hypothetical protein